jgi:hypothetical protein
VADSGNKENVENASPTSNFFHYVSLFPRSYRKHKF